MPSTGSPTGRSSRRGGARLSSRLAHHRFGAVGLAGLGLRLFQIGSVLVTAIVLARWLGVQAYGRFSLLQSAMLLGGALLQVGLPDLLAREVSIANAEERPELVVGIIRFAHRLVAGIALVVALGGMTWVGLRGEDLLAICRLGLGGLGAFAIAWSSIEEAITRGLGRVVVGQVGQLAIRPGVTLLLVLAVQPRQSPATALLCVVAAAVTSAVSTMMIRRRLCGGSGSGQTAAFRLGPWLTSLGPLLVVTALGAGQLHIGILLMGTIGGDDAAGIFAVAAQLATLSTLGLIVMTAQVAPRAAIAWSAGDTEELRTLRRKAVEFSGIMAGLMALAALLVGNPILGRLYGEDFQDARRPLLILLVGQLLSVAAGPVGIMLISIGQETRVLAWNGSSLALQAVLGVLLIPDLGVAGGAVAAAVGVGVGTLGLLAEFRRRSSKPPAPVIDLS